MAAVKQNGLALELVRAAQTHTMCVVAVKLYGMALRFVKNQTPDVCMAAVNRHGGALLFVTRNTAYCRRGTGGHAQVKGRITTHSGQRGAI